MLLYLLYVVPIIQYSSYCLHPHSPAWSQKKSCVLEAQERRDKQCWQHQNQVPLLVEASHGFAFKLQVKQNVAL